MTKNTWMTPALVAFCASACASSPDEPTELLRSAQAPIVNGNTITRGSLQSKGIVRIDDSCGMGSGVLLTNRYVLTARHVVRYYNDWGPGWNPFWTNCGNITITLEGQNVWQDQVQTATRVFGPTEGTGPGEPTDYAFLELPAPMVVDGGASDGYFNPVYPGTDQALKGTHVTCAGYGLGSQADPDAGTLASGAYILRTSDQLVTDQAAGMLFIGETQQASGLMAIPSHGDSGGTCFDSQGRVTGIGSSVAGSYSCWDQNGNGQCDDVEQYNITSIAYVSPEAYRQMYGTEMFADVSFSYQTVPAGYNWSPVASVSAVNGARGGCLQNQTQYYVAARGGWVAVTATNAPSTLVCPILWATAPTTGPLDLSGTCLSGGLVSTVLNTALGSV